MSISNCHQATELLTSVFLGLPESAWKSEKDKECSQNCKNPLNLFSALTHFVFHFCRGDWIFEFCSSARREDVGLGCILGTLLAKITETLFVDEGILKCHHLDDLSSLLLQILVATKGRVKL